MPRIDPDEGPDPEIDGDLLDDVRGDDEPETDLLVACPACRERIAYVAVHCPYCGHWVTQDDRDRGDGRRSRAKALILIVLVVALAVCAILA